MRRGTYLGKDYTKLTFPTNSDIKYANGINNNNFDTEKFPSNKYPPKGYEDANPFGNFRGETTNMKEFIHSKDGPGLYPEAFEREEPLIERHIPANDGLVLHNNMPDNLMDEHMQEYRVMVHSADRDIKIYPDPFSYKVSFNPAAGCTPEPYILKDFRNVKYVRLEFSILPIFREIVKKEIDWTDDNDCNLPEPHETIPGLSETFFKETEDGKILGDAEGKPRKFKLRQMYEKASMIMHNRYIYLDIKELRSNNIYSTNNKLNGTFAVLFPSSTIADSTLVMASTYNGNKMFKDSRLGNLTSLTIRFLDSEGEPIRVKGLDPTAPEGDIRHPLNPVLQNTLSFNIGVVETQLATRTKFEK